MVADPAQYRWSSYRHNAQGEPDALVTPHAMYRALGSEPAERQAAYRALFDAQFAPRTLDAIRGATNEGTVLGPERFRLQIESALQCRVTRLSHGGDRRRDTFQATKEPQ